MRNLARNAALLLAGFVLACSGPGASAPDPTAVLRQAGQAMAGLHSVGADVKFGPGITYQGLTLSSASTSLQLPGESDTVFKVKQGDFLVDVRVVTANGHTYLRLPFSQFTEVTADQAKEIPDLSQLFDQRGGLPAVLAAGKDTRYRGTEQVAGTDSDKVTTTYTADQVGELLGSAARPAGDVQATIWSGRADHYVRRVILSGPLLEAGKNVQVQVDLRDFNKPVSITNPIQT
jgi:LppX_LprAFG lipoprotein